MDAVYGSADKLKLADAADELLRGRNGAPLCHVTGRAQESSIDSVLEKGTKIRLTLNTDKVNVFNADGSANILTGVCNDCAN